MKQNTKEIVEERKKSVKVTLCADDFTDFTIHLEDVHNKIHMDIASHRSARFSWVRASHGSVLQMGLCF